MMINNTHGKLESPIAWLYPPVIAVLLLAGAFWVGRLSAQVDMLSARAGVGPVVDAPSGEAVVPTPALLDDSSLKAMAVKIGVDTNKFNSCLNEGKYAQKIKDDLAYGGQVGVDGTPTFFVNGLIMVGALPQAQFESVIDAELKDGSGAKVLSASVPVTRRTIESGVGYVKGSANAKIKMIEFSDFECPFCARAQSTIGALMAKYGDKISLEYRHNPLPFHSNAQKAAEASECAGEQGKFWEMHDLLFAVHN